jgi:hypothetical protein
MGRGRTTTGMITACMIATIVEGNMAEENEEEHDDEERDDGVELHDATQFLDGEYKAILQLVTVLSHGKREYKARVNNTLSSVEPD